MNRPGPGGRKRGISDDDEPSNRKRARIDSPGFTISPTTSLQRRQDYDPYTKPLLSRDPEFVQRAHSRPLSSSSSVTTLGTPLLLSNGDGPAFIAPSGMALLRSASVSSFRSAEASLPITYPKGSARHCLGDSRMTIDFSMPSNANSSMPLSLSTQNILYFSRGNRVHVKNMGATDDISQLCKLPAKHGDLSLLECGGADQPGVLAIATSKGVVQIWDCEAKKMTGNWSTKGVASMAWNGPVLSIGGLKGTITHFDTRVEPSKIKEQASKVTRHQARISTLSWNATGKILASGDESGVVYCWDARQKVPLDVGEFFQRRKKIQHKGSVSALAWCPWEHNNKLLATGDMTGSVKLWTVDASNSSSNANVPGNIELGSHVVNLHFSPTYKELLSTLGPLPEAALEASSHQTWPRNNLSNSLAVHSYPSLRQITSFPISEDAVRGSVLNPSATKIVVAIPGQNKLKVFDTWGKKKEIKRQSSFLGNAIR